MGEFEDDMNQISERFESQRGEAETEHQEYINVWESQMHDLRQQQLNDRADRETAEQRDRETTAAAAAELEAIQNAQCEQEREERQHRYAQEDAMFADLQEQVTVRAQQRTREAHEQLQEGEARRSALRTELNRLWEE